MLKDRRDVSLMRETADSWFLSAKAFKRATDVQKSSGNWGHKDGDRMERMRTREGHGERLLEVR